MSSSPVSLNLLPAGSTVCFFFFLLRFQFRAGSVRGRFVCLFLHSMMPEQLCMLVGGGGKERIDMARIVFFLFSTHLSF